MALAAGGAGGFLKRKESANRIDMCNAIYSRSRHLIPPFLVLHRKFRPLVDLQLRRPRRSSAFTGSLQPVFTVRRTLRGVAISLHKPHITCGERSTGPGSSRGRVRQAGLVRSHTFPGVCGGRTQPSFRDPAQAEDLPMSRASNRTWRLSIAPLQ